MLKKFTNKKGFTLMEMLIVVAIVAVLVAIAIPTFASQLNKARVAVDEANIRAGYADVTLKILTSDTDIPNNTKYSLNSDGTVADGETAGTYQTKGDNEKTDNNVGGLTVGSWAKNKKVIYTVNGGKVSTISFS